MAGEVAAKTKKITDETIAVFRGKPALFLSTLKSTRAYAENRRQGIDSEERTELTTTVPAKLKYAFFAVSQELDIISQIAATNQVARADLIVDGVTLVADCPATLLLELEKKCKNYMEIYEAAPTLPSGIAWALDTSIGAYIWKTVNAIMRVKTEKVLTPIILVQATDKFPAQVEKVINDVPVAEITEIQWSGMITSSTKHMVYDRCQKLMLACKEARQRANNVDVVSFKIGVIVADYLLKDII